MPALILRPARSLTSLRPQAVRSCRQQQESAGRSGGPCGHPAKSPSPSPRRPRRPIWPAQGSRTRSARQGRWQNLRPRDGESQPQPGAPPPMCVVAAVAAAVRFPARACKGERGPDSARPRRGRHAPARQTAAKPCADTAVATVRRTPHRRVNCTQWPAYIAHTPVPSSVYVPRAPGPKDGRRASPMSKVSKR